MRHCAAVGAAPVGGGGGGGGAMRSHDNNRQSRQAIAFPGSVDDILDSSIVVDAPPPSFYAQDGDGDGQDHFNRAYFGPFHYYRTCTFSTFVISFHQLISKRFKSKVLHPHRELLAV